MTEFHLACRLRLLFLALQGSLCGCAVVFGIQSGKKLGGEIMHTIKSADAPGEQTSQNTTVSGPLMT